MPKITPCLWFDTEAEEAASYYTSIFKNSRIVTVSHYGEGAPRPADMVLTVDFELDGNPFVALNGGPEFAGGFSEALSFQIPCADQEEIDHYWEAFTEEGEASQCGWARDRYGVWWQIFPTRLPELLNGPDKARAERAMAAMLTMGKIDLAEIERAADG